MTNSLHTLQNVTRIAPSKNVKSLVRWSMRPMRSIPTSWGSGGAAEGSVPAALVKHVSADLFMAGQLPPLIRFSGHEPRRDLNPPGVEFAAELWCLLDADVEECFQNVASVDESEIVPGLFDVVGMEEGGEVLVGDGWNGGFAGLFDLRGQALLDVGERRQADPAFRVFLR